MSYKKYALLVIIVAGICGFLLLHVQVPHPELVAGSPKEGVPVHSTDSDSLVAYGDEFEFQSEVVTSTVDQPSVSATSGQKVIQEESRDLDLIRAAYSANNAKDHLGALSELAIHEPDLALELTTQLQGFCSINILNADSEAVRAKRVQFCVEYSGDSAAEHTFDEIVERVARSPMHRLQEKIEQRLRGVETPDEMSDMFTRLVLDAVLPQQVHYLMAENVRSFQSDLRRLWRLGERIQADRYPSADLLSAQTTAIYLYQCARFGGCGSSQMSTIIYCQIQLTGRCSENSTLEEILFQTTPPADFQLANEILGKLLGSKRSGY